MKSMYVDNILETPESTPIYPHLVSWWYFSQVFTVVSSQCYRELGKNSEARQWVKLAMELPDVTNEVMLLRAFLTLGFIIELSLDLFKKENLPLKSYFPRKEPPLLHVGALITELRKEAKGPSSRVPEVWEMLA